MQDIFDFYGKKMFIEFKVTEKNIANIDNYDRPIILVGMMGTGKTHIGRQLAKTLDYEFYDSDDEIVDSAGQSIPSIFEYYGEPAFRDLECRVIKRLLTKKKTVIATGGGAICNDDSRNAMLEQGRVIWLNANLDNLVERTSRRNDRPLLKNGDPREIIDKLLNDRKSFYSQAHHHIDANGNAQQTINQIVSALGCTDSENE